MPRFSGHAKGVEMVRETVRSCLERGVEYLTLFAFSSENWRRPQEEVSLLMQLFVKALEQEVEKLDRNGVRLRIIGDYHAMAPDVLYGTRMALSALGTTATLPAMRSRRQPVGVSSSIAAMPAASASWLQAKVETDVTGALPP